MPSDLIRALGLKHVTKYAGDFFKSGSRYEHLSEVAVEALGYDREREVSVLFSVGRDVVP